jgi:valyl-tRNA synthetase
MGSETRNNEVLPKAYNPKDVEERIYKFWESLGVFNADVDFSRTPYCITIPPPNVTGDLHMGHGLQHAIHDTIVRWKRMQGLNVLCLPGTDHAGIPTQMLVERKLASEGISKYDLGREKFLEKMWEWKEQYGGNILRQLRTMGCSYDWRRERFTLDEGYVRAVLQAFVDFYNRGWIYRGARVINWCPSCMTALSDLEVRHEDTAGHLWHIKYPLCGDDGNPDGSEYVVVATTRPETMLGDTAVAVHPDDPRHSDKIGRTAILPLMNRRIPVIADPILVDPEFGTGAVKVTPAHDPNDFEAGQRNGLPHVVVIGKDGRMTEEAGRFAGLDRYEARRQILESLEELGLLEGVSEHQFSVGHCARCNTVIEPLLSDQWFLRMQELAKLAIEAIESGKVRFVPERFAEQTTEWLRGIHDWCLSRQIWWGHRIPIYTCTSCGEVTASVDAVQKCPRCGSGAVEQDPDVLDTWFSSALWPFAVLGWPDSTPELEYFYPTDLLITARDILRLWVARMIMMSCHFLEKIPFREVYVHATVLARDGRRMSKSLGTGIDPLELIDGYGADATRMGLLLMAAKGQDVRFSDEKMEASRFFCNKLWNASRFVLMNLGDEPVSMRTAPMPVSSWRLADRWIISRLQSTIERVNQALSEYAFDEAAQAIYDFVWNEYCDWYLELAKPRLNSASPDEAALVRGMLAFVLEAALRLLHPFQPFVTEEIWQVLKGRAVEREALGPALIVAPYPTADEAVRDESAEQEFERLMEIVRAIRNLRAEAGVAAGPRVKCFLVSVEGKEPPEGLDEAVSFLARAELEYTVRGSVPQPAFSALAGGYEVYLPLEGLVDVEKEISRLEAEISAAEKEIARSEGKLSNQQFISKAPAEVVEKERRILAEVTEKKRLAESRLEALRRAVGAERS